LSSRARDIIEHSWRRQTRSVYRSRWEKWLGWCRSHHSDPWRPTTTQLIEFLSKLFYAKKLQLSTLQGFKSIVVTLIEPSTASDSRPIH